MPHFLRDQDRFWIYICLLLHLTFHSTFVILLPPPLTSTVTTSKCATPSLHSLPLASLQAVL
ncbi:hypothetical protein LZ31DRAFT_86707 [Colletotrichum somersetense]|nr:hypothetical protein LZ31DRAFT_86707 [Colletotrichum somersetense]